MQKARRHHINAAPTACRHTVSGSFHSATSSSFHLSLTVLVHYRSLSSIQPQQMVLLSSRKDPPTPRYSFILNSPSTGLSPSVAGLSSAVLLEFYGWGSSAFARHYLRNPFISFSSSRYLDVSVPRVCACAIPLHGIRFPHSDIYGSTVVCTSPQLFAAYRVLRHL